MKKILLVVLAVALMLPVTFIGGCKSTKVAAAAQIPAAFVFTTQPSGAVAGAPLTQQPVVTLVDANGNVVTGYNWWVDLVITPGTGASGAQLLGLAQIDAVNGVATFTDISIPNLGTDYTLTATDGSSISSISAPFDVIPSGN